MQEPILKHSHVQINGSYVHLSQYCANEQKCLKFSTRQVLPRLIVFVPGNPGILGIYNDFLVNLFKSANNNSSTMGRWSSTPNGRNKFYTNQSSATNILAISHNNSDHPAHVNYKTEETTIIEPGLLNFVEQTQAAKWAAQDPHHIELQVLNKAIILKRLLHPSTRLVFVGHSIGCYVILRLLQDRVIASAHEGSILIHPALENIAQTKGGSFYNTLFAYKLDYPLRAMAFLIDNLIPNQFKLYMLRMLSSNEFVQHTSQLNQQSVLQTFSYTTLQALIQMAKSEFELIKSIDSKNLIGPHTSRLRLIYAIDDDWVNTDNRKQLQDAYPELYIEEQSAIHAFVMDPTTVMDYAVKIGLYIQTFFEPDPDSN